MNTPPATANPYIPWHTLASRSCHTTAGGGPCPLLLRFSLHAPENGYTHQHVSQPPAASFPLGSMPMLRLLPALLLLLLHASVCLVALLLLEMAPVKEASG